MGSPGLRLLLAEVWHEYIQVMYGYTSEPQPGEPSEYERYSNQERDLLAAKYGLTGEDLVELDAIIKRGDA